MGSSVVITGSLEVRRHTFSEAMGSSVVIEEMLWKLAEGRAEGDQGNDVEEDRKYKDEDDAPITPRARGSQIRRE